MLLEDIKHPLEVEKRRAQAVDSKDDAIEIARFKQRRKILDLLPIESQPMISTNVPINQPRRLAWYAGCAPECGCADEILT